MVIVPTLWHLLACWRLTPPSARAEIHRGNSRANFAAVLRM
jgi:hypothetical protein